MCLNDLTFKSKIPLNPRSIQKKQYGPNKANMFLRKMANVRNYILALASFENVNLVLGKLTIFSECRWGGINNSLGTGLIVFFLHRLNTTNT